MSNREDTRKRIAVALERETYRAVKVRLAEEGMTMQEIGERLFEAWLAGPTALRWRVGLPSGPIPASATPLISCDTNRTPTPETGGLVEIEVRADKDDEFVEQHANVDSLDDVMAGLLGDSE